MSKLSASFWPARAIFLGKGLTTAALLSVAVCSLGRFVVRPNINSWAMPTKAAIDLSESDESGDIKPEAVEPANRPAYRRINFRKTDSGQTDSGQTDSGQAANGDGRVEGVFVRRATAAIAASKAKNAAKNYQQAMGLANQAVVAYQSAQSARRAGNLPESLAFTRQERSLWQDTLQTLAAIPPDSTLYDQAIAKHTQYQTLLVTAEGKLVGTEDDFLLKAIQKTNISPERVHITLCQIETLAPAAPISETPASETPASEVPASETPASEGTTSERTASAPISRTDGGLTQNGSESLLYNGYLNPNRCHHHLGSQPMASPASLIKVPIARVLMHKVATEAVDLDEGIFIDPGNFTENAEGAKIDVGETYPLREVMARMINESNNIATNQLIDYLGRDYLAQTLTSKGYLNTWAGHKLAGDWIMPKDAGTRPNESTTNELTAMLARIYSLKTPGNEELLSALVSQSDREIGYEALKNMDPSVHWVGEKTGQNDRVIATSLAIKIGEERYALTVAIDHSADLYAVQDIIQGVANHLVKTGPLVETPKG